jgi:hypothetical protein
LGNIDDGDEEGVENGDDKGNSGVKKAIKILN